MKYIVKLFRLLRRSIPWVASAYIIYELGLVGLMMVLLVLSFELDGNPKRAVGGK